MRFFLILLLSIFVVLLWGGFGRSFTAEQTRWRTASLTYRINPINQDVKEIAVISSIKQGASVWASWCNANYGGTTRRKNIRPNGENDVFFRPAANGYALATSYWWYRGEQMLEADVIFWDAPWKFYSGSTGCRPGGFYLTDIAAHEFGHVIGIGHLTEHHATMFSIIDSCSTQARTLSQEDRRAAQTLY